MRTGPALLLLLGAATLAPDAGATGSHKCAPTHVAVAGGNVTTTDLDLSADGGTATGGQANGGNQNTATGGAGGQNGAGGAGDQAGTGGDASAKANGGTIEVGSIDTGGNRGNVIAVGPTSGNVAVDGGNVTTTTDIDLSANGGTATGGQANGGNQNTATGGAGGQNGAGGAGGAAGTGGDASAEANGGTIQVESIETGGNAGNEIEVE